MRCWLGAVPCASTGVRIEQAGHFAVCNRRAMDTYQLLAVTAFIRKEEKGVGQERWLCSTKLSACTLVIALENNMDTSKTEINLEK